MLTKNSETILVVDDEASICKSLQAILSDEGYNVEIANTGNEALEFLSKQIPSLVLLDIWMPGIDGIETLVKIKAKSADTPVIIISGHATIQTAVEATKLGAVDFIEKPLDLGVTISAIKKALKKNAGLEQKPKSNSKKFSKEKIEIENFNNSFKLGATSASRYNINPYVFTNQNAKGKPLKQKTLKSTALLYGQGLHSGKKAGFFLNHSLKIQVYIL